MARAIVAAVLLCAVAASEVGCAWGYVTYFEPERKGAREVPHRDPYMRPPPRSGVELDDGTLSVGCTNLRKFVLLPIPWLRRGFRPWEVEIELAFLAEPHVAVIDLASVALTLDGRTVRPSRVEYRGERPPPTYVETLVLPIRGRTRLDAPRLVTFTFSTEIRDASEFRMSLGEFSVDGTRTLLPPLTFSREGQFVVYRLPEKKASSGEPGDEGLGGDL